MIIGIDPGERWTGFAILTRDKRDTIDIGVLDGQHDMYYPVDFLGRLLHKYHPKIVVCEDFQIRGVGHQRFSKALTARVIGAMEYTTNEYLATTKWTMIPPADPDAELKLMKLSKLITQWKEGWPVRSDRSWLHGMSAWRVLGKYLLLNDVEQLRAIKFKMISPSPSKYQQDLASMKVSWKPNSRFLWASPAILRSPK